MYGNFDGCNPQPVRSSARHTLSSAQLAELDRITIQHESLFYICSVQIHNMERVTFSKKNMIFVSWMRDQMD